MSATAAAISTLNISKLTPNIGAEITNIDLSAKQSPEVMAGIHQALLDHKVLFFYDQDISTEQHLDFAAYFGQLEVHPFAPHKEGYPEVLAIKHDENSRGKENAWHSDVTWRGEPSLGSILRSITIPETGGDTLFSNMEKAYDDLDDEMKQTLEGKTAIHDAVLFRNRMEKAGASAEELAELRIKYPIAEHPVIRTHPETGRKSIYVNAVFTQHIVGMDKDESDKLLKFLYSRAAIPEYQVRFRWQKNAIVFWDNRACQHYAVSDYWPAQRSVERVTIVGDKPF